VIEVDLVNEMGKVAASFASGNGHDCLLAIEDMLVPARRDRVGWPDMEFARNGPILAQEWATDGLGLRQFAGFLFSGLNLTIFGQNGPINGQ
jgi:hypothetical protein